MEGTIGGEITGRADHWRQCGIGGVAKVTHQRMERDPAGSEVYLLTDPNFLPIAGNLDRWPDAQESIDGWMEFELHDRATRPGETYLAHARHFRLAGGFHLLVGRDARALQQVQRVMPRAFGCRRAITVALGLVGGLLMSRGALRR